MGGGLPPPDEIRALVAGAGDERIGKAVVRDGAASLGLCAPTANRLLKTREGVRHDTDQSAVAASRQGLRCRAVE